MAVLRGEDKFNVLRQLETHENYLRLANILHKLNINHQGPVVRKVDSAIHWIVIFSTVVKMLEKL